MKKGMSAMGTVGGIAIVLLTVFLVLGPLQGGAQSLTRNTLCTNIDADGDGEYLRSQGQFFDTCPCDDNSQPGAEGFLLISEDDDRYAAERTTLENEVLFFQEVISNEELTNGRYETVMPELMKNQIASFLRNPDLPQKISGLPTVRLSNAGDSENENVQVFDSKAFCHTPTGDDGGCTVADFEISFFVLDADANPRIGCNTQDTLACESFEIAACDCAVTHNDDEEAKAECISNLAIEDYT